MITIYLNKNGAHTAKTEEIIKELFPATNSNFISFFIASHSFILSNVSKKDTKNTFFLYPNEAKDIFEWFDKIPEKSTIFFSVPSILSVDESSSVFEPMMGTKNTVKLFELAKEKNIDLHFFARNTSMEPQYLADVVIDVDSNIILKNRFGPTTKDENYIQKLIEISGPCNLQDTKKLANHNNKY